MCSPIGARVPTHLGLEAASEPGRTHRPAGTLPRPTRGRPSKLKRFASACCKVCSAGVERLERQPASGALKVFQAVPAPPRHPGELCLGQLPAGSTLGSQAPLQSRCCPRRRLLRTLHIYPQALSRTGATRAQLNAFRVSRARTHCRHTRVHVCAHTCAATLAACTTHLAHTLPHLRAAPAPALDPFPPPRRCLAAPHARRRSAPIRCRWSRHAELDPAAVAPNWTPLGPHACRDLERRGFLPASLH